MKRVLSELFGRCHMGAQLLKFLSVNTDVFGVFLDPCASGTYELALIYSLHVVLLIEIKEKIS